MTRPILMAVLGALALAFAGCSDNTPPDTRVVLPINAIAYNDSVGSNDTLFIKVQYQFTTTCEKTATFEISVQPGTAIYDITPVAKYKADQVCTGTNGTDVATIRITDVGVGPRVFNVHGSNQTITANVLGGSSPIFVKDQGIAFRVLVQDQATGAAIPNASVQIRRLVDNFTLADGLADAQGRFDYREDCSGTDIQYVVSAGASGRNTNLVVRAPAARCGIPEFVVIRV